VTDSPNPILPPTALLRPQMPAVYTRPMIYDPTWGNTVAYNSYVGQRIVPAVGSLVRDTDETPLWVTSVNDVTLVPVYTAVPLSSENDNVVSLLDYGNTVFRLYVDYRALPYPATPDGKCIFIGKSPRFYTLTRYSGTPQESVISQYFDANGKLVSQSIPLVALDTAKNSWYLPRCHTSQTLEDNEEVLVKIFGEDGAEVSSAMLFTKHSAVINEDALYAPTIVGMTISGIQQLTNGTFFLYEKQDFDALGLTATLVYDDGTTAIVPLDGVKCILYGQSDFISSFAGLKQYVTVKYYRSRGESITPSIADATGEMIAKSVPVTVIPSSLATTNKITAIPMYNATLARYIMRYWMYFADGRGYVDITGYVSIKSGAIVTDPSYFGIQQVYAIGVDMKNVDPVNYPTSAVYQQTIVVKFGPPTTLVKWTLKDAVSSPYVYGQDTAQARRPSIVYDADLQQYFIPASVFTNVAAFINSFYTQSSPPYDPSVSEIPQAPTHFVIRDVSTGIMLTPGMIPVGSYAQAFNLSVTTNTYVGAVLMVEFINKINATTSKVLYGVPVNVSAGSYVTA
jgi:hypothetical protein